MTKITISPKRRQYIKTLVLSTLERCSDVSLPFKIKALCKTYANIRLVPFSTQMKRRDFTYEQMKQFCGTNDSCADYYTDKDRYIIYYNDIDKARIINSNRFRWNIAHELGHVLLEHHKAYNKTRIFRSSLSNYEYTYLEAEADYFAQLILVPHVVLNAFAIKTASDIKRICQISGPAAAIRFNAYCEWLTNRKGNDQYDKALLYLYHNYIYKKRCQTCGAKLVLHEGHYCPICGSQTLLWGDGTMIYEKSNTYADTGKLIICQNCGNEETGIKGDYCQICGICLVNHCTNINCSYRVSALPSNARYCPSCGRPSAFLTNGTLKPWNADGYDKSYQIYQNINSPVYIEDDGNDNYLPF